MYQRTSLQSQGSGSLNIQAENLIWTGLLLQHQAINLGENNQDMSEVDFVSGLLILLGILIKLSYGPVNLANWIYAQAVCDKPVPYSYLELSQMEVLVQPVHRESCR